MQLFDSHCHLDDERFDSDREELISSLPGKELVYCMCPGSDIPSSMRCAALSEKYPFIYAAAGIHPHEAEKASPDALDRLKELLKLPKVKALGEIGLDYYYDFSPRDIQKQFFVDQMEIAVQNNKPVILHIRDAHGDMIDLMHSMPRLPEGIVHCFSGSTEVMKTYLSMGFYISFAGPVTFKKAPHLWEAAALVPEDRLLIETDSPYLAPEPVRGRRNDPSNVRYICEKIAALRSMDADSLSRITLLNALRIYHIDK